MSEKSEDVIQPLMDWIMQSDMPCEKKMDMLDALDPIIELAHAQGATRVKPVWLITADDIDFDLP